LGMTLVLIMAAWHSGSEKGLRHWALGNLALTMGLVLNISQGLLHHSLSQILAAGLMALGLGVIWLGVRAFKGASQPQAGPLMAALLIMSLLAWFHYVDDNPAARQASVGACLGVLALLSARELLVPARAPLRRAYWFTGGIMLLSGVGLLLRAALSASDTQMTVADTQGLQHATLLSARVLLVPARAPVRRADGFTGGLMLLGGVGRLLGAALSASDTQMTGADTQGLQHATLRGVMVAQIGMAGGFILMTHYRTMM